MSALAGRLAEALRMMIERAACEVESLHELGRDDDDTAEEAAVAETELEYARTTLAEYEKEYGYRIQSEAYAAGLAIHEEMADDKSWTMVHGWHEDFNGTFLQGEIDCSYTDLVKVFGKETSKGDEYKTQAEWLIRFPCGTVATIYDYKQGEKYNGRDGIPKTKVRDWHIGGRSFNAAELVRAAMAGAL